MQKGFTPIFILVGTLVIIATVGGAYFLGKQTTPKTSQPQNPIVTSQTLQPTTISQPSSTPDETANWKTYTSKFGYTFKYPSTWATVDSVGDQGVMVWSKPEYIQLYDQEMQSFTKQDYATIEVGMYLKGTEVADNSDPTGKRLQIVSDSTDPKDFAKKLYDNILLSSKDILLANQPAVEFSVKRMVYESPASEGTQIGTTKQVWVRFNGNLMFIQYHYGNEYADVANLDTIFEILLSTFKFTQ